MSDGLCDICLTFADRSFDDRYWQRIEAEADDLATLINFKWGQAAKRSREQIIKKHQKV
jgi:hypothetical protein